jgi:hypothetical protein
MMCASSTSLEPTLLFATSLSMEKPLKVSNEYVSISILVFEVLCVFQRGLASSPADYPTADAASEALSLKDKKIVQVQLM